MGMIMLTLMTMVGFVEEVMVFLHRTRKVFLSCTILWGVLLY